MPVYRPLADRLEARLEYGAPSGCWLWSGSTDQKGYGTIGAEGSRTTHRTHRAAWMLWRGPIPDGVLILHKCDTPPYCNPAHLFLGDHLANAIDRESKGRGGHPKRVGENHGRAKLTNETAREARARRANGETLIAIADSLGVSFATIWRITKQKPHLFGGGDEGT